METVLSILLLTVAAWSYAFHRIVTTNKGIRNSRFYNRIKVEQNGGSDNRFWWPRSWEDSFHLDYWAPDERFRYRLPLRWTTSARRFFLTIAIYFLFMVVVYFPGWTYPAIDAIILMASFAILQEGFFKWEFSGGRIPIRFWVKKASAWLRKLSGRIGAYFVTIPILLVFVFETSGLSHRVTQQAGVGGLALLYGPLVASFLLGVMDLTNSKFPATK